MNEGRASLNVAGAFVAIGLVSITAFLTWALVYIRIPESNREALTVLIGILSANVGILVGFFFGSSATNRKQADTIEKQASTIQTAQAALAPLSDATVVPVAAGESVTVKADEQP